MPSIAIRRIPHALAFSLTALPVAASAAASDMPTTPPLTYTVELGRPRQTIRNFGSSSGMNAGPIAKTWPRAVVEQLAQWVFGQDLDADGSPTGIALSCFRVQLGAGTAYQGDDCRIREPWRRTECYLQSDGRYDWSQCAGETWWIRQARASGVATVIGYSNSPPIYFTKNGHGYRDTSVPSGNLKDDCYDDFAEYLATVAEHFEREGAPLDFICPVNEPQWAWEIDEKTNAAKQEGSRWHNDEIRRLVIELNRALEARQVRTKMLIPEAAGLRFLSDANWKKPWDNQLRFWEKGSELHVGDLPRVAPFVASHAYGSDKSAAQMVAARRALRDRLGALAPGLEYWQTEYSLLGEGFRSEGRARPNEMEGALFLAKNIHVDLTEGDATAWQFWASFNAVRSYDSCPRFTLVDCGAPETARPTKNLWALGHYSRFVRPGMKRVEISRTDSRAAEATLMTDMASAFVDPAGGQLAVVLINYEPQDKRVVIQLNAGGGAAAGAPAPQSLTPYLTTGDPAINLARRPPVEMGQPFALPGKSMMTLLARPLQAGGE